MGSPAIPTTVRMDVDSTIVHVFVRLTNGETIVIPVSSTINVLGLTRMALKRAARFGIRYAADECVLRTTGQLAYIVCDEDSLSDVLSLTENNTFSLEALKFSTSVDKPEASRRVAATSTLPNSPEHALTCDSRTTYIRWITPKTALEYDRLEDIPIDQAGIPSDTPLHGLKHIATKRLLNAGYLSDRGKRNVSVELFLLRCYLNTGPSATATVSDLGMLGTKNIPLNIFVAYTRNPGPTISTPQDTWGIDSTDRGISTLMTCLKVVFHKIEDRLLSLDSLLKVLWEVTHFPPAVIALKQLYEDGISTPHPLILGVFAQAFDELAQKILPPWLLRAHNTALEGARQVFGWLLSLQTDSSQEKIVYAVELAEISMHQPSAITGRLSDSKIVTIPSGVGGNARPIRASYDEQATTKVLPVLALAMYGNYAKAPTYNYWFCLGLGIDVKEHRREPTLHPSDFDNLLLTTNANDVLKMIGPLQLAMCNVVSLPLLTLDATGFVSVYEQEDIGCSERHFFTQNVIKGRQRMLDTNPGQFLLQKLESIIAYRKAEKSWEVDAWAHSEMLVDDREPEEAIIICVDVSSSMDSPLESGWASQDSDNPPSRLTEVKELFKNIVSRISAYNLPVHLGLVTFAGDDAIKVEQTLTPVLLNFRDALEGAQAFGLTAIWNALDEAADMLGHFQFDFPNTRRRIILLTDGCNNSGECIPQEVCEKMYKNEIILDAIVIGTGVTKDLFKIAKHTGGYAFHPKSRDLMFQIPLLETFIDIKSRPDIVREAVIDWLHNSLPKQPDMRDKYMVPPCRPHANQNDSFIALRDAERFFNSAARTARSGVTASRVAPSVISSATGMPTPSATSGTWSHINTPASSTVGDDAVSMLSGRTATVSRSITSASRPGRVLQDEIRLMIANAHAYMDVFVSESNIGFWEVAMQGPPSTPYEGGSFQLYVKIDDQFPRKAPAVRFLTPILHPNITKHGRICHPIFDREWTFTTNIYQVLQQVFGLLMDLETRDAVDPMLAMRYMTDGIGVREEVEAHVKRFAWKSHDNLCAYITGDSTPTRPLIVPTGIRGGRGRGGGRGPLSGRGRGGGARRPRGGRGGVSPNIS